MKRGCWLAATNEFAGMIRDLDGPVGTEADSMVRIRPKDIADKLILRASQSIATPSV